MRLVISPTSPTTTIHLNVMLHTSERISAMDFLAASMALGQLADIVTGTRGATSYISAPIGQLFHV